MGRFCREEIIPSRMNRTLEVECVGLKETSGKKTTYLGKCSELHLFSWNQKVLRGQQAKMKGQQDETIAIATSPPQGRADAGKRDDGVGTHLMDSSSVQKRMTKRSHRKQENRKDTCTSLRWGNRAGEPSYFKKQKINK